ncbi:unnamed protein product [marine sediment metagenome]|uniref:Uncharacterized protein n=1 Tax=marine sediment metagenome TaxID=412755 RepID=X1TZD8_9ZZZZ
MELTLSEGRWNILKKLVAAHERLEFVGYSIHAGVEVQNAKGERGRIEWNGKGDIVKVTLPD